MKKVDWPAEPDLLGITFLLGKKNILERVSQLDGLDFKNLGAVR